MRCAIARGRRKGEEVEEEGEGEKKQKMEEMEEVFLYRHRRALDCVVPGRRDTTARDLIPRYRR